MKLIFCPESENLAPASIFWSWRAPRLKKRGAEKDFFAVLTDFPFQLPSKWFNFY